jgi:hypothetical protein
MESWCIGDRLGVHTDDLHQQTVTRGGVKQPEH